MQPAISVIGSLFRFLTWFFSPLHKANVINTFGVSCHIVIIS